MTGLSPGAWVLVLAAGGLGLTIEILFFLAARRRLRGSGDGR